MTLTDLKSKINWREPRYMLPTILYPLLLIAGYLFFDIFDVQLAEKPSEMQTTEYFNPELPQAQLRSDGIGGKYENMAKSYGKIQDYSAVENIDRERDAQTEEYNSKYSEDDLAFLDAEAAKRLQEMQDRLDASRQRGEMMASDTIGPPLSEEERIAHGQQRQQEALDELNKALAEARLKGQKGLEDVPSDDKTNPVVEGSRSGQVEENPDAVSTPSEDAESQTVVKVKKPSSAYFNTLAENEPEPRLIKAIIDENIKAVDGSRVRLRLLDDVEINGVLLEKGSYMYATMSGFGQQRVKGNVKSLMVEDELVKVNLTLYDTDGLEGLYVPQSSFRETSKDIASGAMSSQMSLNNGSYNNTFSQWGMQAIQNAYQQTSNAISKAIRKNKATLKYGTFVYLVNSRDANK
ncbi:MAG: conjugative transposon protein TraM [Roseburia sp.]|nr:conjugative transposon protein TraM [Roseburia sp.]MCM1419880.1 conjugative transposon protein TraM [Bacteroides sp.]